MNHDQTAPKEQSDLGPYCLQYWLHLPKNLCRQVEQMRKVVTGGLRVNNIFQRLCSQGAV